MLDDFNLYPTFMEQELLAEKAAQYNMSVNEFIIWWCSKKYAGIRRSHN